MYSHVSLLVSVVILLVDLHSSQIVEYVVDKRYGFKLEANDSLDCEIGLRQQFSVAELAAERRPKALFSLQNTTLRLNCLICVPIPELDTFEWTFKPVSGNVSTLATINSTVLSVDDNFSLTIRQTRQNLTGRYECRFRGAVEASYAVDISDSEPFSSQLINAQRPEVIYSTFHDDLNIETSTAWQSPSECSRCNVTGHAKQFGFCFVKVRDLHRPTKPVNATSLFDFEKGLPCRSHLLPDELRNAPALSNRKSIVQFWFCNSTCTVSKVEYIKNKAGKSVDIVDRSKGRFSFLEKRPTFRFRAGRFFRIAFIDDSITLTCLGTSPYEAVFWRSGTSPPRLINRFQVHNYTHGRVVIDNLNRMIIRRVQKTDENTYSCWHQKRLKSSFRLVVRPPRKEAGFISLLLTNVGTYFIIAIVIILAVSIYKNRKLKNKQTHEELEEDQMKDKPLKTHLKSSASQVSLLKHLDEQDQSYVS